MARQGKYLLELQRWLRTQVRQGDYHMFFSQMLRLVLPDFFVLFTLALTPLSRPYNAARLILDTSVVLFSD